MYCFLLFVLNKDGEMQNIYPLSRKSKDISLLYLKMIKNKFSKSNPNNKQLPKTKLAHKTFEGDTDTLTFINIKNENDLISFIINEKNLNNEQFLFYYLKNSDSPVSVLTVSRTFPFVAYLDSNMVVKKIARVCP